MGVAALGSSGGCSLLLDTNGLVGGAPPESTIGSNTTDAGTSGGSSGSSGSSGSDGAVPGEPCSGSPIHCETFDEGDPLSRNTQDTDSTTSIEIDDTVSVSAPRSAKFVIRASTSNTSPDATLNFRTATAVSAFALEGNVFIEREEKGQVAQLLRITNDVDPPIVLERSGALRFDGQVRANIQVPSGRWFTLRVEMGQRMIKIAVDGVGPDPITTAVTWTSRPISVTYGISEANSPNTGWIVRWDNVVVRSL